MYIAVDFDGTCVSHEFPNIGNDINSVSVLKRLVENGHYLILFTMRSDVYLYDAIKWFDENEIILYGIQSNPTQHKWTSSPKAHADLYIDDCALGCPLKRDEKISSKPFVDWQKVESFLIENNIIK